MKLVSVSTELLKSFKSWWQNDDNTTQKVIAFGGTALFCAGFYGAKFYLRKRRNEANAELSEYFSETYAEARKKFLSAASQIRGAQLKEFPIQLTDSNETVYIDTCYIRGNTDHLLIHISGTHGVEGYAGSAIQVQLLSEDLPCMYGDKGVEDNPQKIVEQNERLPHIIFIHSLNPSGMHLGRRWTQDNIDLNRNAIFPASQFTQTIEGRDISDYSMLDPMLNPERKPSIIIDTGLGYYLRAAYYILRYGYGRVAKATVEGQYFKKNGLFYGGDRVTPEHTFMYEYLSQFTQFKQLSIIDVHTGLGPTAIDTLLTSNDDLPIIDQFLKRSKLNQYYSIENNRLQCDINDDANIAKMYSDQIGDTKRGYGDGVFSGIKDKWIVTQEFGTIASVDVLKALRIENMAFWRRNDSDADMNEWKKRSVQSRNAFYLSDDPKWKKSILFRGHRLFGFVMQRAPHQFQ